MYGADAGADGAVREARRDERAITASGAEEQRASLTRVLPLVGRTELAEAVERDDVSNVVVDLSHRRTERADRGAAHRLLEPRRTLHLAERGEHAR